MKKNTNIISRYAPSPTGVQHLGNLRTALLAWLHARLQGGTFIVRMEDLDVPRVVEGSADQILRDLEWLGLDWDGEVMYQSTRTEAYAQALSVIESKGLVYPCFCSRKDIRIAATPLQVQIGVYPGTCANLSVDEVNQKSAVKQTTFRIRVDNNSIEFVDRCCGVQTELLSATCGDYLIKRADGLFTYQLAVMVDDLDQGVSHIVRGADLLSSTARQIYIAQALGRGDAVPEYFHVGLMLDSSGEKMSKRGNGISAQQFLAHEGYEEKQGNEFLLAYLAKSCGLPIEQASISAQELLTTLDYQQWLFAVENA